AHDRRARGRRARRGVPDARAGDRGDGLAAGAARRRARARRARGRARRRPDRLAHARGRVRGRDRPHLRPGRDRRPADPRGVPMTATTLTPSVAPARRSTGWRGFGVLLATEARLWLRDPGTVFFALVFPTVLLVGVGFAIPGMRTPIEDAPPPVAPSRGSTGWRGFGVLLATEARLWLRDPGTVFFALVFPTVLLVGVGFAIPGMRTPIEDAPPPWLGLTAVSLYAPVVLAAAIATPALTTMPVYFATFREKGLLRRLSTTPMRPQGIVVAHLVINLVAVVVSS